jgi:hypothetical protein
VAVAAGSAVRIDRGFNGEPGERSQAGGRRRSVRGGFSPAPSRSAPVVNSNPEKERYRRSGPVQSGIRRVIAETITSTPYR